MTTKHTHEPDDEWDGHERRRSEYDRRHYPDYPPYFPPFYPQPAVSQPVVPPTVPPTDPKNVALNTMTLQQFGTVALVLGSVFFGGFNYISNVTREVDTQKTNFEQFKSQMSKEIDDIQGSIKELKRIHDETKIQHQTAHDAIERRIQDLDTSVTQLYQKVSAK